MMVSAQQSNEVMMMMMMMMMAMMMTTTMMTMMRCRSSGGGCIDKDDDDDDNDDGTVWRIQVRTEVGGGQFESCIRLSQIMVQCERRRANHRSRKRNSPLRSSWHTSTIRIVDRTPGLDTPRRSLSHHT